MIPEKILDRYIKIKRLAQQGKDGEKATAQRIIVKLEAQYPSIREEAETWERLTEGDLSEEEVSEEPPHWSDVYQEQQAAKRQAEWKNKFSEWGRNASNAFSWVAGMASQAFSSQEARVLATQTEYTKIQVKHNPSGSVTVNVRLTPELYTYLSSMTEDQKAVYSNLVGQRVAADIYGLLH